MSHSEVILKIPTQSCPPHMQTITGKLSPISPDIEEFRGIPYASIPGRWQHSVLRQELPSYNFDATHNGPKCPQPPGPNNSDTFQAHLDFPSDVIESELDCLNLFIQRPSPEALRRIGKENAALPVFVWIHGGGFGFGAGTDPMWDPTKLVLKSISLGTPIITASLNYRLNIFGFLASRSLLLPSNPHGLNFGLQDQHQALRWLSLNISSFGGSPDKITIAGQSAGAAGVHAQVLNARTSIGKPLFGRAVMMSGSLEALGPCTMEEADGKWDQLSEKLGVKESAEERVEGMKRIPARELVDAGWELGWMGFDSVVDGISISVPEGEGGEFVVSFEDAGVREPVIEDGNQIDVLIGETASEGSLWMAPSLPNLTSFPLISSIFHSTYPSQTASQILATYNITPTALLPSLQQSLVQYATDTTFTLAATRATSNLLTPSPSTNTNTPRITVKQYAVQYGNPLPGPQFSTAHHCVDLIYLFDAFHSLLSQADDDEFTRPDRPATSNAALTAQVQKDWLAFITDDVPGDGQERDEGVGKGRIRVYGRDRLVRDQSLGEREWVERSERVGDLRRDWACARKTLGKLMRA